MADYCVYPAILWDNAMRQGALSYTGTVTEGQDPENAIDWRDFSLFDANTGGTLEVTLDSAVDLNMAVVWQSSGTATYEFQYEDSVGSGTYTTLFTFTANSLTVPTAQYGGSVSVSAGQKLRIVISNLTGDVLIRQLAFGPWLVPPIGQRDGLNPPTLNQGIVVNQSIAENGSILGRQVRRLDRKSSLSLEYLSETWIRDEWEPFSEHMTKKACFYAWDYFGFPQEVTMAAAEAINGPTNQSPTFMRVTMPLRNLL